MTFRIFFQILRPISLLRPFIPENLTKFNHAESIPRRDISPTTSSNTNQNIFQSLSTCNIKEIPLAHNTPNLPSQHVFDNTGLKDTKLLDKVSQVLCRNQEKNPKLSFNSSNQVRHFGIATNTRKYTPDKLLRLRHEVHEYSRRYKSKKSSKKKKKKVQGCVCKPPKDPRCQKKPPKFKVKYCVKPFRKDCEPKDPICPPKLEPPYGSYSDCMGNWYEDEFSECINYNEVLLQPKKQRSKKLDTFRAPPPKWSHINPALERICLKKFPLAPPCEDDAAVDEFKNWKNPCPQFKLRFCKKRARKYCGFPDAPKCKKKEAPYPSFTDYCPQFPDFPLNECELAEKYKDEQMIYFGGKSMDIKIEKVVFPEPEDPCNPKKKAKKSKKTITAGPKCRQKHRGFKTCKVEFPFKTTKCGKSSKDSKKKSKKGKKITISKEVKKSKKTKKK